MKRALKIIGKIAGWVVVLIVIAVGTVYGITTYQINKNYEMHVGMVPVPTDKTAIARGKHLTESVGKCQACHGDNYAGKVVMDAPVFVNLTSSNLTSGKGGIGGEYSDEDWIRSIRYGVGRSGKSLMFMPSEAYTHFNDADLGAVIAYLKTLPPADLAVKPARSVGPIGRMVSLVSDFALLPASMIDRGARPAPVPEGVTREYGKYLSQVGGCTGCHGASLLGGRGPGDGPKAGNLTPGGNIAKWTESDFMTALRTGRRPDGTVMSATMPWPYMKGLTDGEIRAMLLYLRSIPAKKIGED